MKIELYRRDVHLGILLTKDETIDLWVKLACLGVISLGLHIELKKAIGDGWTTGIQVYEEYVWVYWFSEGPIISWDWVTTLLGHRVCEETIVDSMEVEGAPLRLVRQEWYRARLPWIVNRANIVTWEGAAGTLSFSWDRTILEAAEQMKDLLNQKVIEVDI